MRCEHSTSILAGFFPFRTHEGGLESGSGPVFSNSLALVLSGLGEDAGGERGCSGLREVYLDKNDLPLSPPTPSPLPSSCSPLNLEPSP